MRPFGRFRCGSADVCGGLDACAAQQVGIEKGGGAAVVYAYMHKNICGGGILMYRIF